MVRSALKLLSYGFLGYFLYEVIQGVLSRRSLGGPAGGSGVPQQGDVGESQDARRGPANVTGPGRGTNEVTLDVAGTAVPHTVGRGVVI